MPRTLGAGLAADIGAATAETVELIELQFADLTNLPTPVFLTTAATDISWNGQTWEAIGGQMQLDALGETTDGPAASVRLSLSGVDQSILALVLGARWRGREAKIYYAHLNQSTGAIVADPVLMFAGLMNGGFEVVESRGDFGGGTVDLSVRLTDEIFDLVKVRGIRTNVQSHRAAIPAAAAIGDTFFQHVAQLALRPAYWGVKTPALPVPPGTGGDPRFPTGPTPSSPFPSVPNPGPTTGPSGAPSSPFPNVPNPTAPSPGSPNIDPRGGF